MLTIGAHMSIAKGWDKAAESAQKLAGVLAEFDQVIGLERLKVIHLNDGMMPFGSRKDRHADEIAKIKNNINK